MKSDKQKAYDAKYLKENTRQFMLKVSRIHDPDMVDWLESKGNINQYLKQLIKEDMQKQQSRE